MKTPSSKFVITIAAVLLMAAGANSLWADNMWDSRHHYRRDNYGYYDGDSYHHYILWHEHHGYWDTRGPVRIFINVD
jgi:hypothetical protein